MRRELFEINPHSSVEKLAADSVSVCACVRVCACMCVCVHACVCVCISFHSKGFSLLKQKMNVMPEIRPEMLCGGNYSVSRTFITTPETIIAGTLNCASNCARVLIKP